MLEFDLIAQEETKVNNAECQKSQPEGIVRATDLALRQVFGCVYFTKPTARSEQYNSQGSKATTPTKTLHDRH